MKALILLTLLATATVAQQDVHIRAREVNRDGSLTKARGDATISNSTVRIQADTITYNRATGEAEATGNVRIKFLSKPELDSESRPVQNLTPLERMEQMGHRFPAEIMAPEVK